MCLVVVAAMLRFHPGFLLGDDPHYHTRIAEVITKTGSIPGWDPLSYGGRHHSYQPAFHILHVSTSLATGVNPRLVAPLLAPILGVVSGLAVGLVANRWGGDFFTAFLLTTFAPIHIIKTSMLIPDTIFLVLTPFFFLFFHRSVTRFKLGSMLASGFLFGLLILTNSSWVLLVPIVVLFSATRRSLVFIPILSLGFLVASGWLFFVPHTDGYQQFLLLGGRFEYVENLGIVFPLGFFGMVWMAKNWRGWLEGEQHSQGLLLLWAGLFLPIPMLAFYGNRVLVYLVAPLAILSSFVAKASKKKKGVPRLLTIFLVSICLTQGFFALDRLEPLVTVGDVNLLGWARSNTPPNGVLLSYGTHIPTYYARHPVVADPLRQEAPGGYARWAEMVKAFWGCEEDFWGVVNSYGVSCVFLSSWLGSRREVLARWLELGGREKGFMVVERWDGLAMWCLPPALGWHTQQTQVVSC
ncbi:MAG: hypothetical protein DRO11_01235 [Methanobacteriota archaeon]|nr:MAG: hypothetical protein DRO11_01235 [Euryarchaeota archaeon]